MDFSYQAEKFSGARSSLMLPHTSGETVSIVDAFQQCDGGLHHLDLAKVDDYARDLVRRLRALMKTDGLSDPRGIGLWAVKAESWFSLEDKIAFSRIVDELAHWFERKVWGNS